MMHLLQRILALLLAGIGLCSAVAAQTDDGFKWKFSGFGTLGAVVTDTNQAEFRSSVRQPRGASTTADLGVDSRLGLQANAKFNDTFSAVGQLLSSRRDDINRPQVEWLFAQAKVTPWLDLRVGRMVLPTFLLSDTRSVGYSQHWLRTPQEAYSLYPPSAFDGAMAHMHASLGDTNVNLQVSVGKSDDARIFYQVPAVGPMTFGVRYNHLYSINLTAERGDWLARFGRTEGPDIKLDGFPLPLPITNDAFTGIGLQYDNGKLLVLSEYLTRRNNTGMLETDSYYFTTGYRFGALMPYVIASRLDGKGALITNSTTDAIGLRWDFMPKAALKVQYESTRNDALIVNPNPAYLTNPKLNALSVAVDFVF